MTLYERISSFLTYGGAGGAAASGGAGLLELTPAAWSAIGVMGGLAIGVLGLFIKAATDIYFQRKHYELARKRALKDPAGDEIV